MIIRFQNIFKFKSFSSSWLFLPLSSSAVSSMSQLRCFWCVKAFFGVCLGVFFGNVPPPYGKWVPPWEVWLLGLKSTDYFCPLMVAIFKRLRKTCLKSFESCFEIRYNCLINSSYLFSLIWMNEVWFSSFFFIDKSWNQDFNFAAGD